MVLVSREFGNLMVLDLQMQEEGDFLCHCNSQKRKGMGEGGHKNRKQTSQVLSDAREESSSLHHHNIGYRWVWSLFRLSATLVQLWENYAFCNCLPWVFKEKNLGLQIAFSSSVLINSVRLIKKSHFPWSSPAEQTLLNCSHLACFPALHDLHHRRSCLL